MKILSNISTAIFALGLCGTASAEVATTPDAPAISVFHQCPDDTGCDSVAQRNGQPATQDRQSAAKVEEAPLPVPELETSLMFMLGLVVLGVTSRRRSSERFDR
ncbi:hypothetical protein J2X54_002920 [Duganella sp. 3397]|uniref:hypothetical protein n=1 Tax=Duganella sp. 3397 TaxID=2817732 RepID=UPI002859FD96|nr:hypothetical protein [Duganella sp. 3397]MDR7050439.1 hypothetical protein [Duganella sp. 3397]